MASPCVIDCNRSFLLPAAPQVVWDSIGQVQLFEQWWSWLRDFRLEGAGLAPGTVLRGVVAPPVPYRMRLSVELVDCEPCSRIDAEVHGDLEGHARLLLEPDGDATRAAVNWSIEMMQRPMRLAARVARPLLCWGHDRVVDMTVDAFDRHLRSRPADT